MCTSLHRMIGDKHGKYAPGKMPVPTPPLEQPATPLKMQLLTEVKVHMEGAELLRTRRGLACAKKQQLYKVTPCSTARDSGFCVPSRTAETQLIIGIYKRQQVILYLIACDMDLNHTI